MTGRQFLSTKKSLFSLLFGSLLITLSQSSFGQGRKPASDVSLVNATPVSWSKNGKQKRLKVHEIGGKDYFSIGSLARLSEAQMRWQPVTHQACLSRIDGLLCFNWERKKAYENGVPLKGKTDLVLNDKHLYVDARFAKSKIFESFSQTRIAWNAKQKVLKQTYPVTLRLPAVQNLVDRYRVGVEFDGEPSYQFIDQSQKRVWIRFRRGRFAESQVLEGDSIVQQVKVVQRRRSADVIITLGSKAGTYDVRFDKKNKRLVLDVLKNGLTGHAAWAPAIAAATKPSGRKKGHTPVADKSIRTIVIDAGHGGIDTGAIGVRGTREKNINLKVAKRLARRLKKEKNLRVILTRDKDEFITLQGRTDFANQAKADLFVSIHCNSSLSSRSAGFEVYILSPDATDEAAAAVARIENSVVQLEAKKGTNPGKLENLLASMAVYDFINESSECGAHICRGVKKKAPVRKTAVREANFYVLRGAQMPGVLVELEYLSNPVTELRLRSSRYRSRLVNGLAAGILEYDRRSRQKLHAVASNR